LTAQIVMPAVESGAGAPRKNSHVPPSAAQGVSSVHRTDVSFVQRWFRTSVVPSFAIGPETVHTPHGRDEYSHPTASVTSPPVASGVSCARPVHPMSSRDDALVGSATRCAFVGHAQLHAGPQAKAAPHAH
jgi:hypothetical protein